MPEANERWMSYPDDRERFSIQLDAAANKLWITPEAALPEAMTQHDDGIAAGNTVLFGCEEASEMRATAKHPDVVF
jgi:hypothetical protein